MVIQYANSVLRLMGDYFSRAGPGAGLAGPKAQAARGGAETSRLERLRKR
jgi:hypothetical protein